MDAQNLWSLPSDFADMWSEDPESVAPILHSLMDQLRSAPERIAAAMQAGDPPALAKLLHTLKGGFAQAGATVTSQKCKEFELFVKGGGTDGWGPRADAIAVDCGLVLAEVEAVLRSAGL